MAPQRILVTGASGNVGTAVLRALDAAGDADVVALARRPPPPTPPYDTARWHAMDLSDPAAREPLERLLEGVDTVVHLVWGFQPTRDVDYLRRVGPDATALVLAAAHRAGVRHFVQLSSVGAYAPRRGEAPVQESYPHTGMPTSVYSTHKALAEAQLDAFEREHPTDIAIARVRPGIVLQREAGAALTRYGLPAYLPVRLLRALPVLPLDRAFAVPVVHSDDLADAVIRIVAQRASGAFNVSCAEPLTRADVASALGARPVHVPARLLHHAVALSWRLHLQPISGGWLDLAFAVPLQDSQHARDQLGWRPRLCARDALDAAIDGMTSNSGTASAALRPRSAIDRLRAFATEGPISRRHRP